MIERITAHEGFPQLKDAQGFELLRATHNFRMLSIINCKWDAKELRQMLTAKQIFMLDLYKETYPQSLLFQNQKLYSLKTVCGSCGIVFPVRKLLKVSKGAKVSPFPAGDHKAHIQTRTSFGSHLWCLTVRLSFSHWYPGSGSMVIHCIDS